MTTSFRGVEFSGTAALRAHITLYTSFNQCHCPARKGLVNLTGIWGTNWVHQHQVLDVIHYYKVPPTDLVSSDTKSVSTMNFFLESDILPFTTINHHQ